MGGDEIEVSDDESLNFEEYWSDKEEETAKIFKIRTDVFDYETPLSLAFNEFNYLLKIDPDLLIKDIMRFKTYEDYKDDWIYEWNKNVPWVYAKPWLDNGIWEEPKLVKHTCQPFNYKTGCSEWPTCSWRGDGYYNGENFLVLTLLETHSITKTLNGRYGVFVPSLTKGHEEKLINTPYPEKTILLVMPPNPTFIASDTLLICLEFSLVVSISSRTPTIAVQMVNFLAIVASWCILPIMMVVAFRAQSFRSRVQFLLTRPSGIGPYHIMPSERLMLVLIVP
nr:hypothetical protein [Tanacetum cinerariifolium]